MYRLSNDPISECQITNFDGVKREIIIAPRAVQSMQRIFVRTSELSLIGAEEARVSMIRRIRKLSTDPERDSRKAKFDTLTGNYRSVMASGCRIYYKVEESQVLILDIFMEKPNLPTRP